MGLFSGKCPLVRKRPGLIWLCPGIGVKRWVLMVALGITAVSLGLGYVSVLIYRQQPLPESFYYITLQFLPRWARAALFLVLGLCLIAFGLYQVNRSLVLLLARPSQAADPGELPAQRESGEQIRIVAIGGGHGLSTLLQGIKDHSVSVTAIVTVADDGGSSGLLRKDMGILPPGDLRNCMAALAQAEPLMTQLFQYRFGQGTGLDGHAFGNLFIAALIGITGSFERAVSEASRMLAVRGRILPSCLQSTVLCAEVRNPTDPKAERQLVRGQSAIAKARGVVDRVYLQPSDVRGYPEAIRAILDADLIVLGPGSLYTSVVPNLLVRDIAQAVAASRALKVYVANVATQPGETDGFTVGDHMRTLAEYLRPGACDYVLANSNIGFRLPPASGSQMVRPEWDEADGYMVVVQDLVDAELPWRHDPRQLATALLRLYHAHQAAASKN